MPLSVNNIKSVQYLLIVRAGLAVMEGSEKSIESLHSESMSEFTTALQSYRLNASMADVDKSIFLRTKNFVVANCKPSDMHTGESIWRKFKDVRRYIGNDMAAAYNKRIPGGQLPSGKSMEEMLLLVRKDLWLATDAGTKSSKENKFDTTWFPTEWLAFMTYGIAAETPADFFRIRESNGPVKSTPSLNQPVKRKSRKEQRAVQRTKEQEERHTQAKLPSKDEKREKKERKVSSSHTAALNYSFALEARKETIKELMMMRDLEDEPEEKAEAKKNLMDFLKTPKPVLEIINTSGM